MASVSFYLFIYLFSLFIAHRCFVYFWDSSTRGTRSISNEESALGFFSMLLWLMLIIYLYICLFSCFLCERSLSAGFICLLFLRDHAGSRHISLFRISVRAVVCVWLRKVCVCVCVSVKGFPSTCVYANEKKRKSKSLQSGWGDKSDPSSKYISSSDIFVFLQFYSSWLMLLVELYSGTLCSCVQLSSTFIKPVKVEEEGLMRRLMHVYILKSHSVWHIYHDEIISTNGYST